MILSIIALLFLVGYIILHIKFSPEVVFTQDGCYIWYTIKSKYSNQIIRDYIKIY